LGHESEVVHFAKSSNLPRLLGGLLLGVGMTLAIFSSPGGEAKEPELAAVLAELRLYEGDREGFEKHAKAALLAGVPEPLIKFVRLQYAISNGDPTELCEAVTAVESNRDAVAVLVGGDANANLFLHVAKARLAEASGDDEAVRNSYMQAFWANPQQASLAATMAAAYQRRQQIASVHLPVTTRLATSSGQELTLAKLLEGHGAVLLNFWASWCGPCVQTMEDFKVLAQSLADRGIASAGVNLGESAAIAESMRNRFEIEIPWLVDPGKGGFAELLRIERIPHWVLIGRNGEILFDGGPNDPGMETAIRQIAPVGQTVADTPR